MNIIKEQDSLNPLFFSEENDAEAPMWEVGNSWTYEITMDGGILPYININYIFFNNLILTVEEVLDDSYKLSFSSDITGSGSFKLDIITISGQLMDTEMEGYIIVNKTKLTINEIQEIIIDGYVKPNLLPKIPLNIDGDVLLMHNRPLLNFPINNNDFWYVDEIEILLDLNVNLLPNPVYDYHYIEGHFAECLEWEIVNVPAGEYDALKISTSLGEEHLVWYSVAAGNIIKMRGTNLPFSYGALGFYDMDIDLKSTNFYINSNPPSTPSYLIGPSEVEVGVSEEFTAGGSIDPDGDMVRYIFNWGDGTQTGSDFVTSGENVTVEHYWNSKGEYDVKVKARDKYGAESGWSDPITVIVLNDPPLKPEPPDGPTNGGIKTVYTYYANSTDPDGHRIFYKFDWGDGQTSTTGLVNSGETASASHSWRRKGTYQIRVKAIDEYSEESPWSEPLIVTMPRNKELPRYLNNFKEKFPTIYLIIQKIIQLLEN